MSKEQKMNIIILILMGLCVLANYTLRIAGNTSYLNYTALTVCSIVFGLSIGEVINGNTRD